MTTPTAPTDAQLGPVRRLVFFLLGVAVIVDAVVQTGGHGGEFAAGLILLGLIPFDSLLERLPLHRRRERDD